MILSEIKYSIGIFAVVLILIGYIPYFRDILKGKTIPHIYSWLLWGLVGFIIFALQLSDKAGIGAFVSLAAALIGSSVIILSLLLHKGKRDITKLDTVLFILAFISLGFWLIAKQPIISAILATSTDLLAFVPTIRKSWAKPFSETLSFYFLNTFRFGFAVASLQHYSFITTLYPISWILANGFFAVMLIIRRKQITS